MLNAVCSYNSLFEIIPFDTTLILLLLKFFLILFSVCLHEVETVPFISSQF